MSETELADWLQKEWRRQQETLAELDGRLETLSSRLEAVTGETADLGGRVERLAADAGLVVELQESLGSLRQELTDRLGDDRAERERERQDQERIRALDAEREARELERLEKRLEGLPEVSEQVRGLAVVARRLEERLAKFEGELPGLQQRLSAREEHDRLLERRLAGDSQREDEWEALRTRLVADQSSFVEEQKRRFQDVQRTLGHWQEEMAGLRQGWEDKARELRNLLESAARVPKLFSDLETLRTQLQDDRRQMAHLMEVMEDRRQRGVEEWQAIIESRLTEWNARQEQNRHEWQKWREVFEREVHEMRQRQAKMQRTLEELLRIQQDSAQRQLEEMQKRVGQMEDRLRALS